MAEVKPSPGKVRIIAGRWRGRKLPVADVPGLRPTPDRVRETLFNWLQALVPGAHCLDLFAGTGVLGFEALSRGAASVQFVDQDPAAIQSIRNMAQALATDAVYAELAEAGSWLTNNSSAFDIIFLDPPFHEGLLAPAIDGISGSRCLKPGGLIYIECEAGNEIPAGLYTKKQKITGEVQYGLYELSVNSEQ